MSSQEFASVPRACSRMKNRRNVIDKQQYRICGTIYDSNKALDKQFTDDMEDSKLFTYLGRLTDYMT